MLRLNHGATSAEHPVQPTFISYPLDHGLLADLQPDPRVDLQADRGVDLQAERRTDLQADRFPASLSAWNNARLELKSGATHFGYVYGGQPVLECAAGRFTLQPGMYFAAVEAGSIGGAGRGMVVSRWGARAFFHLGGPIETTGRLRYIDGCTDSLLVPPVVKGDACLNLLHIPAGTRQSQHTHPSYRVGMIVQGHGHCVTPVGQVALEPGQLFVIRAGGQHSFHTDQEALTVIAFHPDSDFGPTHTDHPMLNRTHLTRST